ncbi:hypothetical protein C0991_006896, partial [Blastosporella zonata]
SMKHPLHLRVSFDLVPDQRWCINFPLPSNLQTLEIEVDSADQLRGLSFGGPQPLDSLLAVDLQVSADDGSYSEYSGLTNLYPLLPHAPSLRMLSLRFPDLRVGVIPRLGAPWEQLTHICLHEEVSLLAWHIILRSAPRLQKCYAGLYLSDADNEDEDHDDVARLSPVILSHLRELDLAVLSPFSGMAFKGLLCPNLTKLAVRGSSVNNCFIGIAQPLSFCMEVAHKLRHLELVRQNINARSVIAVLKMMPELVSLSLDCAGDHDALLRALTVKDNPTRIALVPRLKVLSLTLVGHGRLEEDAPRFSVPAFARVINSRWFWGQRVPIRGVVRRVRKLKFVGLIVDRQEDRKEFRKIKYLLSGPLREGLEFRAAMVNEGECGVVVSGDKVWSSWKKAPSR